MTEGRKTLLICPVDGLPIWACHNPAHKNKRAAGRCYVCGKTENEHEKEGHSFAVPPLKGQP